MKNRKQQTHQEAQLTDIEMAWCSRKEADGRMLLDPIEQKIYTVFKKLGVSPNFLGEFITEFYEIHFDSKTMTWHYTAKEKAKELHPWNRDDESRLNNLTNPLPMNPSKAKSIFRHCDSCGETYQIQRTHMCGQQDWERYETAKAQNQVPKPSEWIEEEVQKYIAKHDIQDPTLRLIAYIHPIMSLLDYLHSQGKINL